MYNPSATSTPLVTTCTIPADQTGTIEGQWPVNPIVMGFHQGDFDPNTEIPALVAGTTTWNTFFTASKKITLFNAGAASAPTVSPAADPVNTLCSATVATSSGFSGTVLVYKLGSWPYSHDAMALTNFCTVPQTPYKRIKNAVIEINYEDFFVAGKKIPDLQTIFTHELGHLLGLNHSCASAATTGFPNCNDPTISPTYASMAAIMYPSFGFYDTGNGIQDRTLGTNDQERANCLYGPQP